MSVGGYLLLMVFWRGGVLVVVVLACLCGSWKMCETCWRSLVGGVVFIVGAGARAQAR
jgi:hypothetical protein